MFEAVLLSKAPSCWIHDVIGKYPASATIVAIKPLDGEEGVQELFEISAKPEIVDRLAQDLHRSGSASDVELVKINGDGLYGSAKVRGRPPCRAFIESKCFLTSVRTMPDYRVEWRVRGAGIALKDLMERLEGEGLQVEVKRISNLSAEKPLTPRQERVLATALERGYFEFPRRINLRELAEEVGVKPATLSEVLRRGQRKALTAYLQGLRRSAHLS